MRPFGSARRSGAGFGVVGIVCFSEKAGSDAGIVGDALRYEGIAIKQQRRHYGPALKKL
jgi:hypothetical protein